MWNGIGNYFDWFINYAKDLALAKAIFLAEQSDKILAHLNALASHIR